VYRNLTKKVTKALKNMRRGEEESIRGDKWIKEQGDIIQRKSLWTKD